ncbi:hypothetical protein GF325_15845 [Candidatus Bathyarchaeota archaeon]|nr:hypothetical protein [Candidatus Bathyarchaeota archaeon]
MAPAEQDIIKEGNALFRAYLIPDDGSGGKWEQKGVPTKAMPVFYNPKMGENRDLSVFAVQAWNRGKRNSLTMGDIFCGSGIRGIRYITDLMNVSPRVDFVDMNPKAIKSCRQNLKLNGIDESEHGLHVRGANDFLYQKALHKEERFDVIDVDPFGNPMKYMSGALEALDRKRGLLHVNATDLAVLAGVHFLPARRKYQTIPLKNVTYHAEQAARIVVGAIARKAMQLDIGITPLLSMADKHFIKLVLETKHGATHANRLLPEVGYIVQCRICWNKFTVPMEAIVKQDTCPFCSGNKMDHGGPIWIGELQNKQFCLKVYQVSRTMDLKQSSKSLQRKIHLCFEEAGMTVMSFDIHQLSKEMKVGPPKLEDIISKLEERGWKASRTQFNPTGIKTLAPREIVRDIVLELEK